MMSTVCTFKNKPKLKKKKNKIKIYKSIKSKTFYCSRLANIRGMMSVNQRNLYYNSIRSYKNISEVPYKSHSDPHVLENASILLLLRYNFKK